MRVSSITSPLFLLLATLPSSLLALTITSPSAGQTIDPTQPIVITWTTTSSDPSTIYLTLSNNNPGVLATEETLANGVDSSLHSFTVPANTVQNFGTGFVIDALSAAGTVLASSGAFILGAGAGEVSTVNGGGATFISTNTATTVVAATATATDAITTDTNTVNSATATTDNLSSVTSDTAAATTTTGTVSASTSDTLSSGGFTTSTESAAATTSNPFSFANESGAPTSTTATSTSTSTGGAMARQTAGAVVGGLVAVAGLFAALV